jgi:hypothetical protein
MYKTIIVPVVLYLCETWSLILRVECRLRAFRNRVLRRIFGPKRDEETGGWRKLHNEELHNLYSSPCIIRIIKSRRMKWAGRVARIGEKRNAYRILVGKSEGKRQLGNQDVFGWRILKLIGWDGVDWIEMAQDRDQWRDIVNAVLNFRVP